MKLSEAEAIFNRALEQEAGEQRAAFLQRACGEDAELRAKVGRLLQAHEEAGGFLQTRTSPLAEGPGTQIGKFKILELIGEGGFGVVYMAEQKEPVHRRVALKIIKLGMDTKQVVARFEAERQALAMMDHPNIARVLDGGCTETGRPYFVMEIVKGCPITKFCDDERLSTRHRLELFISVCRAVQHAHQKGLVHRDLKPSNVLVSYVDGHPEPKIIDFGIAKAMQHDLTDKTVFTRFRQFMGTPAYMSPEQAGTDTADIDTRSDIYSLGVLLYELLTGRTPLGSTEIVSADYDEIRRQIREVEPLRPSNRISTLAAPERTTVAQRRSADPGKLSRLVSGDLDWIVLKAMEKDRNRRYQTANEFAKDIQRYLDNEPVAAVKPSTIYYLQKYARRHKWALATAACFALLLAVSAGVAMAQAIKNRSLFTAAEEARLKEMSAKEREMELRRIAEEERRKAEAERDRSQNLLYIADMHLAKRAWDDAKVTRVADLLDMHRPQPDQPDLRTFEWYYLDRLCHNELLTLKGHTGGVGSVAISPDGKRLASGAGELGKPGELKIWDTTTGKEMLTFKGHTKQVWSVVFSPDGQRLATAAGAHGGPGELKVWNPATGQEMLTLEGHTKVVTSVAFSPDGTWLAAASEDKTVRVWNATSGQETLTLHGHSDEVWSVAFSPDGKRLASAAGWLSPRGKAGELKVWDAKTGQELLTWKGHTGIIWSVAFSPDGTRLVSAGSDGTVKGWDAATGQELLTLKGHDGNVFSVRFSPDGKRLASASDDQRVKVWNAASGQEMLTLKGALRTVAFSPDGKWLASAGLENTVKLWDATSEQESLKLMGQPNGASGVAISPDGKRLACAVKDQAVKLWDAMSGRELLTLKGCTGDVLAVKFSLDGKRLAANNSDRTVKVWDAVSGQELLTLKGHPDSVWGVAFSPDGKWLASGRGDGTVDLWDATSGQETLTLKGHTAAILGATFSPDGKRLASASADKTIKVWDPLTGQELLTLKGHTHYVWSVAFSPDGRRLASGSRDLMVKVWDTTSGEELFTLKGHEGNVLGVAFSPDGKRLASSSHEQTVKLWDTQTGRETLTLKGQGGQRPGGVVFSPDGKRLMLPKADMVESWDARPRQAATASEAQAR